jgi:ribonucleoside-diphosphate reductase alpha chain
VHFRAIFNHEQELMSRPMVLFKTDDTSRLKRLVQTVWEMSMKDIIDMSHHYFVDQSQSLNLFMKQIIIQN